jgi:short subunit dehydrogenase-like uncharacterized protein
MDDRDLSVLVVGASGITGRQVAAHLARCATESEISWAAAGRDPEKVKRVLGEIGVEAPEILRVDFDQPATLRAAASRARVVLNLAGPYTIHGEAMIRACISAGSHYADLSGEIPFLRRMIDAHQEQAMKAGVKVVNVSGFEALPADLLVLLAAETARSRWEEELEAVDVDAYMFPARRAPKLSESFSGGTMQSLVEAIADEQGELTADPAALLTDAEIAERVRRASPIALAPRSNVDGDLIGPMIPVAFINPAVIQRTAALIAAEEKRDFRPFRYREGVAMNFIPTMPLRYAAAAGATVAQTGLSLLLRRGHPVVRRTLGVTLRKALPGSGFGPTGKGLEEWSWRLLIEATAPSGSKVRIDADGDGHPGYLATAKLLAEAGLLLAEDGATPPRAGFLTPATALGTDRIDRLRRAGMRVRVSA